MLKNVIHTFGQKYITRIEFVNQLDLFEDFFDLINHTTFIVGGPDPIHPYE